MLANAGSDFSPLPGPDVGRRPRRRADRVHVCGSGDCRSVPILNWPVSRANSSCSSRRSSPLTLFRNDCALAPLNVVTIRPRQEMNTFPCFVARQVNTSSSKRFRASTGMPIVLRISPAPFDPMDCLRRIPRCSNAATPLVATRCVIPAAGINARNNGTIQAKNGK